MLTKIMYTIHRVLGTLLSALFVMWFISGIVMIYHTFPSIRRSGLEHKAPISSVLPSLQDVCKRLPVGETIRNLTLSCRLEQPVFDIITDKGHYLLPADSTHALLPMDKDYFYRLAGEWCKSPVVRVDSLTDLEQWIPFGRLKQELPIYKFYFNDTNKSQLYISSKSGEVLQYTTWKSRFWSWVGAIPHWVYFTRLRQDIDLWKTTVIILSAIGVLMTIAGIYVGIHAYLKARRMRGRWVSPYKKRWYYWHHVTGFLFGLFVLTWIFSGMMSLADTPEWLAKEHKKYPVREILSASALPFENYPLDYRKAIEAYPGKVTEVKWSNFREIPVYEVLVGKKRKAIDASGEMAGELNLTASEVYKAIQAIHPGEEVLTPELLTHYDTYYIDRKKMLNLPVWKVEVVNPDQTCYYINPKTGQIREYNTRGRWHFWMYPGLHSLKFKWLVEHPVVWSAVMWILLLGGTAVSVTGVVLGCRYLKRKNKNIK